MGLWLCAGEASYTSVPKCSTPKLIICIHTLTVSQQVMTTMLGAGKGSPWSHCFFFTMLWMRTDNDSAAKLLTFMYHNGLLVSSTWTSTFHTGSCKQMTALWSLDLFEVSFHRGGFLATVAPCLLSYFSLFFFICASPLRHLPKWFSLVIIWFSLVILQIKMIDWLID